MKKYYREGNKVEAFDLDKPPLTRNYIHIGTLDDLVVLFLSARDEVRKLEKALGAKKTKTGLPLRSKKLVKKTSKMLQRRQDLEFIFRQREIS